jgi:hypothetical protein
MATSARAKVEFKAVHDVSLSRRLLKLLESIAKTVPSEAATTFLAVKPTGTVAQTPLTERFTTPVDVTP